MYLCCLKLLGCLKRQAEFQAKPKEKTQVTEVKIVEITHEENDWGIELVSETAKESPTASSFSSSGLKLAYEPSLTTHSTSFSEAKPSMDEVSLEDLMAQMKNM